MSLLWNLLDDGMSDPSAARNWKKKLLFRCGRLLVLRHKNVHLPTSSVIHPGAKIHPRLGSISFGEHCAIADSAIIQGNVKFGDHCSVQPYTIIVGNGSIDSPTGQINIGSYVRIASHGMIIAANHNFSDPEKPIHGQGLINAPITIEDDVWIGGRVNITAGVTIGKGSVIGAGSVVTHDIPAMSIAVGIPAKAIKSRK